MSVTTLANETVDATNECVIGRIGFFGAGRSRPIISRFLRLPGLPGDHNHPRLRIVLFG